MNEPPHLVTDTRTPQSGSREPFLVTGAGGFIGGHVARHALARGYRVRAMVRRHDDRAEALAKEGAEIALGDILDSKSLATAVTGCRGVYHIAALYRQAGLPEGEFFRVNAQGTRNVFEAAVRAGVGRLVYCSTGGVLGDIRNPPGNDSTPYNPGDMYQRSKVEAERIALEFFRSGKIRGVVIRPAMVFGPGDTRHLKLFKMVAKRRFFYVGKGDAWVHFIDVRDLARAFVLGMEHEERNGEIYSIPGREVRKLHEAIDIISSELAVKPPWLHLPVKPMQLLGSACETVCRPLGVNPPIFRRRVDFFTKSRYFDGSKAERELGFVPAQSFAAEVSDTVAWYRSHGWL